MHGEVICYIFWLDATKLTLWESYIILLKGSKLVWRDVGIQLGLGYGRAVNPKQDEKTFMLPIPLRLIFYWFMKLRQEDEKPFMLPILYHLILY